MDEFTNELDKLFDIGAADATNDIMTNRLLSEESKAEDLTFYQDQRGERKMFMSGHDAGYKRKFIRKIERQHNQARLKERHSEAEEMNISREFNAEEAMNNDVQDESMHEEFMHSLLRSTEEIFISEDMVVTSIDESEDIQASTLDLSSGMDVEATANDESDAEWLTDINKSSTEPFIAVTNESHVALMCPRKIMESPEICTAADRLKLTDNQATAFVAAVLKACKADLCEFSLSRSTTQRRRSGKLVNLYNFVSIPTGA